MNPLLVVAYNRQRARPVEDHPGPMAGQGGPKNGTATAEPEVSPAGPVRAGSKGLFYGVLVTLSGVAWVHVIIGAVFL